MFRFSSNTVEAFAVEDNTLLVYLLNTTVVLTCLTLILIGVYHWEMCPALSVTFSSRTDFKQNSYKHPNSPAWTEQQKKEIFQEQHQKYWTKSSTKPKLYKIFYNQHLQFIDNAKLDHKLTFISDKPHYYLYAQKDTQHNRQPITGKNVGIWSTWVQRVVCFMQIHVTQHSYVRKVLPVDLQYSPTILLQFHHFLSVEICQNTSVYTHILQCSEYHRNPTLFLLLISINIFLIQMCIRLNDLCWGNKWLHNS